MDTQVTMSSWYITQAMKRIEKNDVGFIIDRRMNKFIMSFNPLNGRIASIKI